VYFKAEDGIRDRNVTGVQTCALPIFFEHGLGAGGWAAVLAGPGSAYHEVMGENYGLSHDEQYSTALTVEDFRANIAEVDERIAEIGRASCREGEEVWAGTGGHRGERK